MPKLNYLCRALVVGLAFTALDPSLVAFAKPKAPAREVIETTLSGRKNPKATGLTSSVGKLLQKAQTLAEDEKYVEAVALIDEALTKAKTPYDRAKANQIKASYLYNAEKNTDAIAAARAALAADGLDNIEFLQTKLMIAQLLTQDEKYEDAIKAFDEFAAESPKVKGSEYIIQSSNYYYLEKYKEAITFADKAFATGEEPSKAWAQLRLNSFYQGEDYDGAVKYATELMAKEPENKQWLSIAVSSYLSLEKYKDAITLLNAAKAKNMLDSDGLWTQLYQLYSNDEQYAQAGATIEEGISKGFLKADAPRMIALGQNYTTAGQDLEGKPEGKAMLDKAIDAFKRAIPLDMKSGEAEVWLGQLLLLDRDDPKGALGYLSSAVTKTLKSPGNAYYLLGVAQEQSGNKAAARVSLVKAQGYPESKTNATNYLKNLR
jgi:tetratricopeptide (TPR) repeat protein